MVAGLEIRSEGLRTGAEPVAVVGFPSPPPTGGQGLGRRVWSAVQGPVAYDTCSGCFGPQRGAQVPA